MMRLVKRLIKPQAAGAGLSGGPLLSKMAAQGTAGRFVFRAR